MIAVYADPWMIPLHPAVTLWNTNMTIHVTLCPENKEQINRRKLFTNFSQKNTDNKKICIIQDFIV